MGGVDQFEQKKHYHQKGGSRKEEMDVDIARKPKEQMTERDWRIFRENNDIMARGGRIPYPIRNWDEVPNLNQNLHDNISYSGFSKPMPIQM